MSPEPELVWLTEERTFAELVSLGAYFSVVKYTRAGMDYEIYVQNDEFEFWKDHDYDSDGD